MVIEALFCMMFCSIELINGILGNIYLEYLLIFVGLCLRSRRFYVKDGLYLLLFALPKKSLYNHVLLFIYSSLVILILNEYLILFA